MTRSTDAAVERRELSRRIHPGLTRQPDVPARLMFNEGA